MEWQKQVKRRLEGHQENLYVFHALISQEDMSATREELEEYAATYMDGEIDLRPALHTLQANFLVTVDQEAEEETYALTELGEEYLRETKKDFETLRKQLKGFGDLNNP